MRRKVSCCLYVEPGQKEALQALSEKTHVPQSVYLREAIEAVLKKYGIRVSNQPRN